MRGPLSQKNLKISFDIETSIIGDAAFYLFSSNERTTIENKIIVNMGTHALQNSREQIIFFLQKEVRNGVEIHFLPFHSIDLNIAIELKKRIPELIIQDIPKKLEDGVSIMSKAKFAIGERLHFNILCTMVKCPFLSVNYSPKHSDFLN